MAAGSLVHPVVNDQGSDRWVLQSRTAFLRTWETQISIPIYVAANTGENYWGPAWVGTGLNQLRSHRIDRLVVLKPGRLRPITDLSAVLCSIPHLQPNQGIRPRRGSNVF